MHQHGSGAGGAAAGLGAALMEHYDAADWAWIAVALLATALLLYWVWCLFHSKKEDAPPMDDYSTHDDHSTEQGDHSTYVDESVTSHDAQPGSVTARNVIFSEPPPGVSREVLSENERRDDEFVTRLRLDLTGRPPVLGVAVRGDHIKHIHVGKYVPPGSSGSSMLSVTRLTLPDGRDAVAINDPNPGAYVAEIQSTQAEPHLEVEEFVS